MFNLSSAIREWRKELAQEGLDHSTIEELECHLKEHVERLTSEKGISENEAFATASKQLGSPGALAPEFRKVQQLLPADKTFLCGVFLLGALIGIGAAFLAIRMNSTGKTPLLWFHVTTLTVGYAGMFLFAISGGYSVFRRIVTKNNEFAWFGVYSLLCRWAGLAGLVLVSVGLISGGIWARENLGSYWTWTPPEIGGLCVWLWYVAVFSWSSFESARHNWLPALTISGGIVCLAAWFGVNGMATAPAFLITVVIHIVLLAGALRLFCRLESKSLVA